MKPRRLTIALMALAFLTVSGIRAASAADVLAQFKLDEAQAKEDALSMLQYGGFPLFGSQVAAFKAAPPSGAPCSSMSCWAG